MKSAGFFWIFFAGCASAPMEPARAPEPPAVVATPERIPENPYSAGYAIRAEEEEKLRVAAAADERSRLEQAQAKARLEVTRPERCKARLEAERAAAEELTKRAQAAVDWAKTNCDLHVNPPVVAIGQCPPTCEVIRLPMESRYEDCRAEEPSKGVLDLANIAVNGKLNRVTLPTDADRSCER